MTMTMNIQAPQILSKPRIVVVIPYINEKKNIQQALNGWLNQKYSPFDIVVVNSSSELFSYNEVNNFTVLTPPPRKYWNPNYARNYGARRTQSDYIVFTTPNILPSENFLDEVSKYWDNAELIISESLVNNVPSRPELENLIIIKRWVNSKLRGFNEEMMLNPHGWGYDSLDYIFRTQKFLASSGGRLQTFPIEKVNILSITQEEKLEPYTEKNIENSYKQHKIFSETYIKKHGVVANKNADWGN
ncbi:MAG: glycosyltransferase [Calditrichaeota bacterium]|nr:MAG: glycosyltransferase [Calditrichota bacterium]